MQQQDVLMSLPDKAVQVFTTAQYHLQLSWKQGHGFEGCQLILLSNLCAFWKPSRKDLKYNGENALK